MKKTITLSQVLNSGISYKQYKTAKQRGLINVLQIGNSAVQKETIIDAEPPYLNNKTIISC